MNGSCKEMYEEGWFFKGNRDQEVVPTGIVGGFSCGSTCELIWIASFGEEFATRRSLLQRNLGGFSLVQRAS